MLQIVNLQTTPTVMLTARQEAMPHSDLCVYSPWPINATNSQRNILVNSNVDRLAPATLPMLQILNTTSDKLLRWQPHYYHAAQSKQHLINSHVSWLVGDWPYCDLRVHSQRLLVINATDSASNIWSTLTAMLIGRRLAGELILESGPLSGWGRFILLQKFAKYV
jgi:hypothetical protein